MQLRLLPANNFVDSRGKRVAFIAARALALFIGGFSLLNVLGNLRHPGFDANLWWIDLRLLPEILGQVLLLVSSVCLLNFAVRSPASRKQQLFTAIAATPLALMTFWNVLEFYSLLFQGRLHALLPIPLSLLFLTALILIIRFNLRPVTLPEHRHFSLPIFCALLACLVSFPLVQMISFGKTDYRRPADVAVVFGARAYADGRPSDTLADRVRTACQLYRDGLVKKLIFSGGPGDGKVHETESMRRLAVSLGVNPADILTDTTGFNSQATVNNTLPMFKQLGARRIIVVSHFYHLPRIKLAYQRAGWDVYTVPAKESYYIGQTPYLMVREVAALWVYYLRPLVS